MPARVSRQNSEARQKLKEFKELSFSRSSLFVRAVLVQLPVKQKQKSIGLFKIKQTSNKIVRCNHRKNSDKLALINRLDI